MTTNLRVREIKLCLLGAMGVGKSSIVLRFVRDQYKEALEATIGASFMTKRLVVDGNTYVFQIWDTAGQEKYRALAPMYYRGAAAAIVVYDVTNEASFRAVKEWVTELKKNSACAIVLAIAGNKCDLVDLREVNTSDAQDYADSIDAIFTETSALSAVNINELFEDIARKLPLEEICSPSTSSHGIVRPTLATPPKKSCCWSGGKT